MFKISDYDSCRRLILGRRFGFEPNFASEEEHLIFTNTYIDFKCESMVMSLGILLKFLDKYIPQRNLSHRAPCINVIQHISLERLLSIDEVSYKALQIFNTQHHPSAFKRASFGSNREGLSIFSIFSRCKSRIGTKKMRQIFMNPIKNIEVLNSRLDAIQFCTKPKHEHIVKNLTECIRKVDSVTGILTSMYRSRSNINHWKSLYSSLYNAILIGQICSRCSSHSEMFMRMAKSITKKIHEVAHYINHVVDFEESSLRNQFTVRAGIDSKLDKMRETYANLPDVLIKVAELEMKELPECIVECSVVYITELGYLLSVPIWKGDGNNIADYQMQNFQAKFIANKYVHYKTPRCKELDNVLGDMLAGMCAIESKIMIALMEFIHERVPDIVHVVNCVAELDCIIALADTASENNYTRPILTTDRILEITKGRHPLMELCVENFVPNDAKFSKDNAAIQILTGPNASGKSVYLKQTAVIVFLAHLGSFVPAERAVIGILDHIHCLNHVLESVSTRLSSFVLDLKQMSRALYCSTPSSLIIIDEFGMGTTEIDGLSLLAASLIHFAEREENCPFIAVSTHFHNLSKLLPRSPIINTLHMDYIVENGEIVYVHRIKNGNCNSSLAHLAATKAGLSEKSVERFLQVDFHCELNYFML
ncbi:UNVERIFIED_CONTAM: hypothetical protein PYX00_001129 [Menopon gallinae]|uniref:MutS-like protein n=1 Tax=Menopon gallinae TaxID=328185 RepID=A0AAW2ICX9_9NEOP